MARTLVFDPDEQGTSEEMLQPVFSGSPDVSVVKKKRGRPCKVATHGS